MARDWRRIEREVSATQEKWPPFTQIATASLGIGVSAFFGWMQWGSVFDGLTVAAKESNYWQGSFLGIAAIASVVVAIAMFIAEWSMRQRRSSLQALAQQDMAEIFDAATKTESDTNGPIPDGLLVCHHCDNRACVRPDHLFLGTYADNMQDASRKGRMQHGSGHHGARLSEADVVAAKAAYAAGAANQYELARLYGVSQSAIWAAIHGKTWRHVQ